jgi:DNA-binding response OmpR family regulator
VLVAEDDPAVLALITSVLERAGFEVSGATDADGEIRIAARYRRNPHDRHPGPAQTDRQGSATGAQ